jgi:HAD superfamily hydrolase (TIGR01549 family)
MCFRGVIFDMDGTITEPYLDFARIREEVDVGERDLLDHLQDADETERARLFAILRRFEVAGVENAKLNRGARELLDFLSAQGLPTALLTRNSRQSLDGVCRKLGLQFDISFSREEGPHKPAPDAIWEIARRWNAKPSELLMVGDYKWDLMCARNAGSPCAILTNGDPLPDWAKEADYLIHELGELIGILSRSSAGQRPAIDA